MEKIITKAVIKLGRSIATSKRNKIDRYRFEQLAKQIKVLHEHAIGVVFVVSAAVCCGEHELRLSGQQDLSKSLIAGVGQMAVMAELYAIFSKHNLAVGQLLVTKSDLKDEKKRANIKCIIAQALEQHITLIVNENDIVELHSFEGNDYLAAEIATLIHASDLVFLTDVAGIFDREMQLIKEYSDTNELAQIVKVAYRGEVGGMLGKIDAALRAVHGGITTWIASGKTQNLLTRMFLENEHIGTRVLGGTI